MKDSRSVFRYIGLDQNIAQNAHSGSSKPRASARKNGFFLADASVLMRNVLIKARYIYFSLSQGLAAQGASPLPPLTTYSTTYTNHSE